VVLAAGLSGAVACYTALTMWQEGLLPLSRNQTENLWGVQVWWDLLASLTLALFRARAPGMRMLPWFLAVTASGSIGPLAMAARLFWLERRALATAG